MLRHTDGTEKASDTFQFALWDPLLAELFPENVLPSWCSLPRGHFPAFVRKGDVSVLVRVVEKGILAPGYSPACWTQCKEQLHSTYSSWSRKLLGVEGRCVCVCREKKPLGLAGILEFHGVRELCGVHASGTPNSFKLGLCWCAFCNSHRELCTRC